MWIRKAGVIGLMLAAGCVQTPQSNPFVVPDGARIQVENQGGDGLIVSIAHPVGRTELGEVPPRSTREFGVYAEDKAPMHFSLVAIPSAQRWDEATSGERAWESPAISLRNGEVARWTLRDAPPGALTIRGDH